MRGNLNGIAKAYGGTLYEREAGRGLVGASSLPAAAELGFLLCTAVEGGFIWLFCLNFEWTEKLLRKYVEEERVFTCRTAELTLIWWCAPIENATLSSQRLLLWVLCQNNDSEDVKGGSILRWKERECFCKRLAWRRLAEQLRWMSLCWFRWFRKNRLGFFVHKAPGKAR